MNGKFLFSTLLILLLALAGCGQQGAEPAAEQAAADTASGEDVDAETRAWETMLTELRAVETDEEKVPILKTFVENHPNNEQAAYAMSGVIYYLGEALGKRDEALLFCQKILPTVTDPDVRREMQLELLGLYGRLGDAESLQAAAEELAGTRPLTYAEHSQVAEAALDCEAWELAANHTRAGLDMSSAEAYRADYPGRTFTDDEVAEALKKRQASSLASMGWALAHLGKVDMALETFLEGSSSVGYNYAGVPDSPLFSYWGRTLAEAGQNNKAMDLLVADAILGGDVEAMDALHGAYTAVHGEEGFEDYLWQNRQRLAVRMDDFTLQNYQGEPLSFSQLKGQVVLLSFWFPT